MDAGLMGKGIGPDNRFIRLDPDTGDLTYQSAGGINLRRHDIGSISQIIGPRAQRHHQLLQR